MVFMFTGVAAERVPCVTSGSLNQLGLDNEIQSRCADQFG